jgi:hypothetical protein
MIEVAYQGCGEGALAGVSHPVHSAEAVITCGLPLSLSH